MFKKGQPVHFINSWNHAAQVMVKRSTVHSCGSEQMILVDDAGVKFGGRNFIPKQQQSGYGRVFANLSDVQAECIAEAMCEEIRLAEIMRCERAIASCKVHDPFGSESYRLTQERNIKQLLADQAKVVWS